MYLDVGQDLALLMGICLSLTGVRVARGLKEFFRKKMGVRMLEQDSVTSIKDSEDCDCCMLTCLCMTVGDWVTTVGEMC